MTEPSSALTRQILIEAIEENIRAFLLALGRTGGGEERADPSIQWIVGGSPIDYHNCVVRADLTSTQVSQTIEQFKDHLQCLHVPGTWHIGPQTRPLDLGQHLLAHGFSDGGQEAGMAVDLRKLNESITLPEQLSIERVRTESDLTEWTQTLAQGFGAGPEEAAWVGAMYRRFDLDEQGVWQHYIGRWQGEAVATTTLFLEAGVAGIYFVFTLPHARRRGIGAAMVLRALQDARQRGCRIGVLGSSNMGKPVYQRLGFEEYCQLAIYEWCPKEIDNR